MNTKFVFVISLGRSGSTFIQEFIAAACRPQHEAGVQLILFFKRLSSTELRAPQSVLFTSAWYVDMAAWMPINLRALNAYASEMRLWPHSPSMDAIEALVCWRRPSGDCVAAEAFMLGRCIRRASANSDPLKIERQKP